MCDGNWYIIKINYINELYASWLVIYNLLMTMQMR